MGVAVIFGELRRTFPEEHECIVHSVPHFEEPSMGVAVNYEFIFGELHGTFPVEHECIVRLVPRFEEPSMGVAVNYEFIFGELHGTFPVLTVADLKLWS